MKTFCFSLGLFFYTFVYSFKSFPFFSTKKPIKTNTLFSCKNCDSCSFSFEKQIIPEKSYDKNKDKNNEQPTTWYPIGFSKDFGIKPQRVVIRDKNYVVWKHQLDYYGLKDCCSHQGSALFLGKTYKNTIACPYHGYVFDGTNGELIEIPKMEHVDSESHNIDSFKVVEKGGMLYLNTVSCHTDDSTLFVEPEYYDKNQRSVLISEDFEHHAKFVTVNSLDICHIGFVHTFGNNKNPNPLQNSKIEKMKDTEHHYKIVYKYMAGKNSLVNKIYRFDEITVENEYILPHTTVARVKFGSLSSTIITHALPISKWKTRLFVKAYRNYWSYDLLDTKNWNLLFPLFSFINLLGDKFTQKTMYETLKQDKAIIDNIDKSNYEDMHGKFSIVFDKFSNHYKSQYKKMYQYNDELLL